MVWLLTAPLPPPVKLDRMLSPKRCGVAELPPLLARRCLPAINPADREPNSSLPLVVVADGRKARLDIRLGLILGKAIAFLN
jgi:hypothetical protein